ncbi:MAG: TerB family tellurite resistance protein, partial [Rhodospirillaceae bacterium]
MSGLSEGRLKGAIRDALNDRNRVGRKDLTGETIPVAAAYLLELGARIDKDYHRSERARIQDLLRHCFRLTDLEAKRLLIEAESLYVDEADWLEQVRRLDQQFSMAERETLMDMMWDVIHSD